MAYLRGWRVSYLRQPEDGGQRPFSVVLEHRDKQEALHFESGAITELNQNDYALIKERFARIEDIFGCLGVFSSRIFNHTLKAYPSYLVVVTECKLVGKLPHYEAFRINNIRFICLDRLNYDDESNNEVRCAFIIYSLSFAFTKRIQPFLPVGFFIFLRSVGRL